MQLASHDPGASHRPPPIGVSDNNVKPGTALKCDICGIESSRPSHLARHRRVHLPPGHRRLFSCPECGKPFSRKDVLSRHVKTAHLGVERNKESRRKSCLRCAQTKLRCNRTRPCYSCDTKGVRCCYSSSTEKLQRAQQTKQDQPSIPTAHPPIEDHDTSSSFVHTTTESSTIQESDTVALTSTGSLISSPDGIKHAKCSVPFALPDILAPTEFGIGDFDWLNFELDSPDYLQLETDHSLYRLTANSDMRQQPAPASLSNQSQALERLRPPLSRTQSNGACPQALLGTREQWPFDDTAASEPRKVQLPPLRQILESSVGIRPASNRSTLDSLIDLLSSPYLPAVEEYPDLHTMPAIALLKQFLTLYLTEFSSIIPMIHVPSWDLTKTPSVLLAAMACIGACFSDAEGSCEIQWSLSEISLQTLSWLGGSDSTNYRDPAFVTACCLHQIYSLGSGNRHLYQNADASRGVLVIALRALGMLKSRLSMDDGDVQRRNLEALPYHDGAHLTDQWLSWRNEETEKRITWASFEYDCSLCTLTSRRGAMDLYELPMELPCHDSLWEAPSAQAWAALAARSTSPVKGVILPRVLRDVFAQKPIPSEVSTWGKRICAQIIGRLLWDLKQIEMVSMSDFLGLPSLTAAHKPTKEVLLACLSNLCSSITHPTCTADLIHLNITSLIWHYSHLYTSEEAMDLVVYMFRGAVHDRRKQSGSELDSAKRRLTVVLAKNPQQTRAMVWHAAQIIATAREYFIHAPCETMRVFMGHIFILACAKYGSLNDSTCQGHSMPPVRLDDPTWRDEQKVSINQWIQTGGAASIGPVEDIGVPTAVTGLRLYAVNMMREMRVWGLARKFCTVLEAFET